VTEAALEGVVQRAGARGHVVVDDERPYAVALERDRSVALLLHELPEELIAHGEQDVLAVGGFAKGEQARSSRQQAHDGGAVDGMGRDVHAPQHYR